METDVAIVSVFEDRRPLHGCAALLDWRLNGRLSQLIVNERFKGKFKEIMLMPAEGRIRSKNIFVLGLGSSDNFNESTVTLFTQFLLEKISHKNTSDFMISFSDMITDRFEWRNSIRLLVSKLHDFPKIESVKLCESEDCVRDAKKRHMDFGMNVDVSFETMNI